MSSRPMKSFVAEKAAKEYLEGQGWTVHRAMATMANPAPGKFFVLSHDVFGAIDLVAMHPQQGFLYVQVTTIGGQKGGLDYAAVRKRKRKIELLPWPHVDGYAVAIWGARNVRHGQAMSRYFQEWRYDVRERTWRLLPERIAITGPAPG